MPLETHQMLLNSTANVLQLRIHILSAFIQEIQRKDNLLQIDYFGIWFEDLLKQTLPSIIQLLLTYFTNLKKQFSPSDLKQIIFSETTLPAIFSFLASSNNEIYQGAHELMVYICSAKLPLAYISEVMFSLPSPCLDFLLNFMNSLIDLGLLVTTHKIPRSLSFNLLTDFFPVLQLLQNVLLASSGKGDKNYFEIIQANSNDPKDILMNKKANVWLTGFEFIICGFGIANEPPFPSTDIMIKYLNIVNEDLISLYFSLSLSKSYRSAKHQDLTFPEIHPLLDASQKRSSERLYIYQLDRWIIVLFPWLDHDSVDVQLKMLDLFGSIAEESQSHGFSLTQESYGLYSEMAQRLSNEIKDKVLSCLEHINPHQPEPDFNNNIYQTKPAVVIEGGYNYMDSDHFDSDYEYQGTRWNESPSSTPKYDSDEFKQGIDKSDSNEKIFEKWKKSQAGSSEKHKSAPRSEALSSLIPKSSKTLDFKNQLDSMKSLKSQAAIRTGKVNSIPRSFLDIGELANDQELDQQKRIGFFFFSFFFSFFLFLFPKKKKKK